MVSWPSEPAPGVPTLIGSALALRQRDQLLERLHAEARLRRQRVALAADHGDVGEVADRVVADVGVLGRPHDVRARAADQQRVAVGVGARDVLRRHRAAGADPVLDVELLLEGLRQVIGGDAAEPVGGAAGAERHHHLHRPVRPVLGLRRSGAANAQAAPTTAARPTTLNARHPSPPTCRRPRRSAIIPAKSLHRNRRPGNWGERRWKASMASHGGRFS